MEIAILGFMYWLINRLVKRSLKRSYAKSAERRRENLLRRRALENTGNTVVVDAANGEIISYFSNPRASEGSERAPSFGNI